MMARPQELVAAAKLPRNLLPWNGDGRNARLYRGDAFMFDHTSMAALHLLDEDDHGCWGGYTIMDDSDREIRRHMDAILYAKGRVLKTGLGFGCFVRACLAKPEVNQIDVVEIDRCIIDHFGSEFAGNPRVTIHHADAFEFELTDQRWDLGWHDIYCDANDGLETLHVKLIHRYREHCDRQGAWALPRWAARMIREPLVGSPRRRRAN